MRRLHNSIASINNDYLQDIELSTLLTTVVENPHAVSYCKHETFTALQYSEDLGLITKESLKRVTKWAAKYFTHEISYYPVPQTSTEFANVNFVRHLPSEEMDPEVERAMKVFLEKYRPRRERIAREETNKDRAGALPPAVYTKQQDSTKVDLLAGNNFNSGDQSVGFSSAKGAVQATLEGGNVTEISFVDDCHGIVEVEVAEVFQSELASLIFPKRCRIGAAAVLVYPPSIVDCLVVQTLYFQKPSRDRERALALKLQINVHVTMSHGEKFSRVHSPSAVWVQSVTARGFEVCARESGNGSNGTGIINWLAFQDHPQMTRGSAIFDGIWTTETKCEKVTYSQNFPARPSVFVSSKYTRDTKPDDAMYVWLENVNFRSFEVCIREFLPFDGKHQDTTVGKFKTSPVVLATSNHQSGGEEHDAALIWMEDVTKDSFKVCLRELQNFDGKHQDIYVTWMAFAKLHKPLFTEYGSVNFPNTNPPTDGDNNAYCEFVRFTRSYNATPSVQLSANHSTTASGNLAPVHNGISTWIENLNVSGFRVCAKELYETRYDPLSNLNVSGFRVCAKELYETRYDPVSVSYAVLTDLNECQNDLNYCHNLATCTNERGSHKCKCKAGYVGDGFDCYYSYAGLGHSAILANDDNYLGTLSNWLSRVVQSQSSYWKRCWRASVDGWPASTFHSLCDNKGPTVTIIRVGKYIFGGYTSSSWTSGCSWLCRSTAFLFSLVNKPGWGPVKLSQPGQHDSYSSYTTYGCSHRGPSFGGAHDIYIPYHASNTKSESQLGYTYSPPTGYNYGSSFAKSFLAGGYNFRPGEVEVFYETF
ncbi:Fibrillin-1 [Stylophora pistillata]|uniref:Fibrillin-1 n=1 Tax=Stylophora pistillata TaxID=50429 RepID=A0A2B4R5D4_STYPI|nr:Fibrillin-1 [Stylophora pistillata]